MVFGTSLRYIGFTRTRENVRKEGTSMIIIVIIVA